MSILHSCIHLIWMYDAWCIKIWNKWIESEQVLYFCRCDEYFSMDSIWINKTFCILIYAVFIVQCTAIWRLVISERKKWYFVKVGVEVEQRKVFYFHKLTVTVSFALSRFWKWVIFLSSHTHHTFDGAHDGFTSHPIFYKPRSWQEATSIVSSNQQHVL